MEARGAHSGQAQGHPSVSPEKRQLYRLGTYTQQSNTGSYTAATKLKAGAGLANRLPLKQFSKPAPNNAFGAVSIPGGPGHTSTE